MSTVGDKLQWSNNLFLILSHYCFPPTSLADPGQVFLVVLSQKGPTSPKEQSIQTYLLNQIRWHQPQCSSCRPRILISAEDPVPCPSFRSGFLFTSVRSPQCVPSVYNIDSVESSDFQGFIQFFISRQSLRASPGSPLWLLLAHLKLSSSFRPRLLRKRNPILVVT